MQAIFKLDEFYFKGFEIITLFLDLTLTATRNAKFLFISTILYKKNVPHWCASGKPLVKDIADIPWVTNEPDNSFSPESLLAFMYVDLFYGIGDVNVFLMAPYVCQSP